MAWEDSVLEELQAIRQQLNLLVIDKAEELGERIKKDYLRTEKQRAMYGYFDGQHSIDSIAKELKVSHEAVRVLVATLEKKGLIHVRKRANQKFPERII